MSIVLSPELEAFVRDRLARGQYLNETDVIRAAFSLLERREELLAHLDEGTEQLRRGEYAEYSEHQQPQFVAAIEAIARRSQGPQQSP